MILVKLDRFILLRGKPIKTLGSFYQAANANCESFAFTFFAWLTVIAYRAVHSVTLCPVETMQAHHKET